MQHKFECGGIKHQTNINFLSPNLHCYPCATFISALLMFSSVVCVFAAMDKVGIYRGEERSGEQIRGKR